MVNIKLPCFMLLILLFCQMANAQHFLSTQGKTIVNENQEPILLRGMGLGGWMVQEGYMLQTASFANPQHEIRGIIEELIGQEDTEAFYEAWLTNHVQKSDIDSLKAWGFNSVRLPMHYNLFTLPIEEEPVLGQDTWLDKGFQLTDSLVSWCKANEMYIILDMHAAPGGQGYDAAISDYDPTKPSLWESVENRRKLVALWQRIAEYYADEQWIAGYDLLNEPNWDLPGGNALRSLYQNIVQGIREVDGRHIVFIEGNWFANDFTGLTPPWDDNFVYSPHKYWSTNDVATMQWVIDLRNTYNVPLYLGESGENSNVWFRDAIALLEGLDIGWAWWPMKKVESIAGPLSVVKSPEYQTLLDYWSGTGSMPSAAFARAALMDLAEKLKTEHCVYQKDVIDAMFRQVYSDETIPFAEHRIPGVVHASDYDMGVIGSAYDDVQSGNYSVSTGEYSSWNDGWQYRNDGVDIEYSENTVNTNGYNVGFMDAGEWMQYTVTVEEDGVYEARIRTASGGSGGFFHLAMDGGDIIPRTFIDPTGDWQNWQTVTVSNIILDAGMHKLRFYTDVAGFNVANIEFVKTIVNSEDLPTLFVSAETVNESSLQISINKSIQPNLPTSPAGLEVSIDGAAVPITEVSVDPSNTRVVNISVDHIMNHTEVIKVTYIESGIESTDGSMLQAFTLEDVKNSLDFVHQIPTKIEAESFVEQSGIVLETSSDIGGGQNVGYLDPGDYMEYDVNISEAGDYRVNYRTAAEFGTGALQLQLVDALGNVSILDSPSFSSTGGWQSWTTTTRDVSMPQGRYTLRIRITQAPFNLNWLEFNLSAASVDIVNGFGDISLFPNPSSQSICVEANLDQFQKVSLEIIDLTGRLYTQRLVPLTNQIHETFSINDLRQGIYLLKIELSNGSVEYQRFVKY